MAAGASILDGRHPGKFSLITKNKRMGIQQAARAIGGEALEDDEYEIEMQKEKNEDEPPVPKNLKQQRETTHKEYMQEKQEFRKKRKHIEEDLRKNYTSGPLTDIPEEKRELNPLLKVKSKDGTIVFEGNSGGDASETSKTPVVQTPAREAGGIKAARVEAPSSSGIGSPPKTKVPSNLVSEGATKTIPAQSTVGGLLGYALDDDNSDSEESEGAPNYDFLNLGGQASAASRAPAAPPAPAAPQPQAPRIQLLQTKDVRGGAASQWRHSPADSGIEHPPQKVPPPKKAAKESKEDDLGMSPALAALMAGFDI